jgi:NAD(P)-dependent dehydrogenase (short-subunit alcohol dehydrogenase family)
MSKLRDRLFDLTGRIAWVVGGGGYLARPVCQLLAELGAKVIIADHRIDAANEAIAAIGAGQAMSLDAGDERAIAAAVEDIARKHGRLDIAVNMATFSTGKQMDEMSADDFAAGLKTTLTGAFLIAREAAKLMVPRRTGSIIQFASMYGVVSPDPAMYAPNWKVNPIDYGAAKAGVLQMTRYQAVMWGPSNVRVNAIVPGPFPNPAGMGDDNEFVSRLARKTPLNRVGRAEEIAGAVAFLASDASSYVTGTSITVDGGWTAW